jgi:hypothetical protein
LEFDLEPPAFLHMSELLAAIDGVWLECPKVVSRNLASKWSDLHPLIAENVEACELAHGETRRITRPRCGKANRRALGITSRKTTPSGKSWSADFEQDQKGKNGGSKASTKGGKGGTFHKNSFFEKAMKSENTLNQGWPIVPEV